MIEKEDTLEVKEQLHSPEPDSDGKQESVPQPETGSQKAQWQIMLEHEGEVSPNTAPDEPEVNLDFIQIREPEKWEMAEEAEQATRQKKRKKQKKDHANERHLQNYRSKITDYKIRKWRRIIIVTVAVLVVVLIITVTVRNWKYDSFRVVSTNTEEDTVSFTYCSVEDEILKYGIDIATLTNRSGKQIWSTSYSMTSPTVDICGETVAIYDKNGTGICICDSGGQIGSATANLPIVKAKVASQGTVAAIVDDGSTAMIQYYTKTGDLISTIRTTIDNPGYPMDLALSSDGTLLAVTYLYFENGTPKTRLNFYNFGSAGQNQMDNNVSGFEYSNVIVPEVVYLSGDTCVAFRENGLTFFSGSQIPQEDASILVDKEIISTFHDSSYVGIITKSDDPDEKYTITIYDKNGEKVFEEDTGFSYLHIEIKDKQVVLSNSSEFCVYSLNGVLKYDGAINAGTQEFFSIGKNRYVYVTESDITQIKLG